MNAVELERIDRRRGRAIVMRGDDIDTDVIMPARFLKATTYDGLGENVFRDVRAAASGRHPFDRPEFSSASILVVGANFGCGSSREHAPRGLERWGIRALVGESFAEIFLGNCVALGLPAVAADPPAIARLMERIESDPVQEVVVDLDAMRVTAGGQSFPVTMPEGARARLREGHWDAMRLLLSAGERIHQTADRLPYIAGF